MKDLIITICADTRKVKFNRGFIGVNGENLQGNIIVDFTDKAGFVDGLATFEVEQNGNKYKISMTKDSTSKLYKLPIYSSLLAYACEMKCQLVITQSQTSNGIPVFKSEIFKLPCYEAINANGTIPEQYPAWIDTANAKILEMDALIADIKEVASGKNILINPDFSINQRGQTSYTAFDSSFYCVDRIYLAKFAKPTITQKTGGGISVSGTATASNSFIFTYFVEEYKKYAGKTLTLSAKISNVTGTGLKIRTASTDTGSYSASITTDMIYTKTFTVNESPTVLSIVVTTASAGDFSFDIDWWKLEEGSVATAFIKPLISEELLKCKRYYQIITRTSRAFSVNDFYEGYIQYSTPMRIAPSRICHAYSSANGESETDKTMYSFSTGTDVGVGENKINSSIYGFTSYSADGVFVVNTTYQYIYRCDAEIYY